jgi:hypothetical protein
LDEIWFPVDTATVFEFVRKEGKGNDRVSRLVNTQVPLIERVFVSPVFEQESKDRNTTAMISIFFTIQVFGFQIYSFAR